MSVYETITVNSNYNYKTIMVYQQVKTKGKSDFLKFGYVNS